MYEDLMNNQSALAPKTKPAVVESRDVAALRTASYDMETGERLVPPSSLSAAASSTSASSSSLPRAPSPGGSPQAPPQTPSERGLAPVPPGSAIPTCGHLFRKHAGRLQLRLLLLPAGEPPGVR
ncbi:hypothetical protein CRUP_023353, partial [Coryphaenoides rupestris]